MSDQQIGSIQGKVPDSSYEWYVAVALWQLGWDFVYQKQWRGGRASIGGLIIDFLVSTLPKPTPLFVDGEYWHGGPRQEEADRIERALFTAQTRGRYMPYVALVGRDVMTQEAAITAVTAKFGRA